MMSPAKIDRVIDYGILAFIACGACWLCGLMVSAVVLGGLGASSGSFDNWRTERGLWMLAALFLLIFGGLSAFLTYHQIGDWFDGRALLGGGIVVDWIVGTSASTFLVRFLWSVTYWNRKLSADI